MPSKAPCEASGLEALWSPISCGQNSRLHGLPWVLKGRFEQMLIKGGAAMKPPEARLKGPERLIKIRRPNHARPCMHPNLVSNPTLLKLCRRKKSARLLLPWSLSHTPAWLYKLSLSTKEGAKVFHVLAYCVPPLPGKEIKPLFPHTP